MRVLTEHAPVWYNGGMARARVHEGSTMEVEQWQHDPDSKGNVEAHDTDGPCFACWCYGCGRRTTGPRDMTRGNQSKNLKNPTSHRWCFE